MCVCWGVCFGGNKQVVLWEMCKWRSRLRNSWVFFQNRCNLGLGCSRELEYAKIRTVLQRIKRRMWKTSSVLMSEFEEIAKFAKIKVNVNCEKSQVHVTRKIVKLAIFRNFSKFCQMCNSVWFSDINMTKNCEKSSDLRLFAIFATIFPKIATPKNRNFCRCLQTWT